LRFSVAPLDGAGAPTGGIPAFTERITCVANSASVRVESEGLPSLRAPLHLGQSIRLPSDSVSTVKESLQVGQDMIFLSCLLRTSLTWIAVRKPLAMRISPSERVSPGSAWRRRHWFTSSGVTRPCLIASLPKRIDSFFF